MILIQLYVHIGRRSAVKMVSISGRGGNNIFDPPTLVKSIEKEIRMAYTLRRATQHVVTIYGFDFDPRTGLALMAMELGGDTLTKRIQMLHMMKDARRHHHHHHRHYMDGMISKAGDYIPSRERKDIWIQLHDIVKALHHYGVVCRSNHYSVLLYSIISRFIVI